MLIMRWIMSALAVMLAAHLVSGITVHSVFSAFVVALVFGLFNAVLRPVLIFLTLPITILSLGLFTFVINALLFWFTSAIVKGFYVESFGAALLGAIIMWLAGWLANIVFMDTGRLRINRYSRRNDNRF